jgi:hypothetical protein
VSDQITYARDFGAGRPEPRERPDRKAADLSIPRIARLMALAIRFEGLLRSGTIRDCAELARLGRVTRARVTQIMKLLNLAPDIQEQILFLPPSMASTSETCGRLSARSIGTNNGV